MNGKIMVAGAVVGVMLPCLAEDFYLRSGSADWSQKESFAMNAALTEEASRLPVETDDVYLPAGDVSLTSGTASFSTAAVVGRVVPKAATRLLLTVNDVRAILDSNRDNVVIIDEAYVDFGGKSCLPLIQEYDNLLVVQTFSKSRSLAGARLGFGFAQEQIIADLNRVKYSTNPYNINRCTLAAGAAALQSQDYYDRNCRTIIDNRAYTTQALQSLGFEVLPSKANFIFARHAQIGGEALYRTLKDMGILVRHFTREEIADFVRITIGSIDQMRALIEAIQTILAGGGN